MLKWNFDVEHVAVILGHNVEYTGSMLRLPILVLKRKPPGEGAQTEEKFDFFRG